VKEKEDHLFLTGALGRKNSTEERRREGGELDSTKERPV